MGNSSIMMLAILLYLQIHLDGFSLISHILTLMSSVRRKRDGWDAISAEVCTSKLGSKYLCSPYWDCILIYVSRCKGLDLFGVRSGFVVSLLLSSISLSLKWLHWYFLTEICGRILGGKVVMNFKGWNTVQKGA